MNWLGPIGTLLGMGRDYLEGKRVEAQQDREHNARIKEAEVTSEIERAKTNDGRAADLDVMAKKSAGWKDEWLLIITTMPLAIAVFAPLVELWWLVSEGKEYVQGAVSGAVLSGVTSLNGFPDWYLVALALVYVDTFGFRRMLRVAIEQLAINMANKFKT